MAGRTGVGRRTAVTLVAHMHQMTLVTPKISRGYTIKNFKNDLKTVMQQTGIEGEQAVLLLEDHHFLESTFLELVNSLLSAGEVPGLYTPEELEPLLAPLRDLASEANHRGTLMQFFASRESSHSVIHCPSFPRKIIILCVPYAGIKTNLHVALIMDCTNSKFSMNCESNPAFFKQCTVLWMDGWSRESMVKV